MQLYGRRLTDLPVDAVAAAINDTICRSSFFPTIADIRRAAAEHILALPSEADALSQVEVRAAWARDGRAGDAPTVDPLVREALEHVGGFHGYRQSDNHAVFRGQFLRLYREMRETAVLNVQTRHPELAPAPNTLALPSPEPEVS